MIVAVVLSGGESSRMGQPKALLPFGKKTFIEQIVSRLQETKVAKILLVLGHHAAEIKPKIAHLALEVLINNDYKQGQLSSLKVALRHIEAQETVDGALVHLVDHPFLSPFLVDEMIKRFYESKKLIVLPRYHGRRGHPVLFSRKLFKELIDAPLDQGAKAVVHAHLEETLEIETEDEGVMVDIDTPEDYRRHAEGIDVKT